METEKDKPQSRALLWVGLAILALVGIWYFFVRDTGSTTNTTSDTQSPGTSTIALKENDHIIGDKESPIVLVEFGDYQCPACAAYHPFVKQLVSDLGSDLALVYRHYPLTQIHKNALAASIAAEAAGVQGKFWEMHDKLYEKQVDWSDESDPAGKFVEYAKELELDEGKFQSDLKNNELRSKVDSNTVSGNQLKVRGTPTFFANGILIENIRDYEEFKSKVEATKK